MEQSTHLRRESLSRFGFEFGFGFGFGAVHPPEEREFEQVKTLFEQVL